ncbi:MAG: phosphonate ABC transporter, permease protein PhnE [Candidatus Sumerlaeota bacterium]|nr:phosphonate ABC transporter, permease protein PhnE [Candidatus Sumerlaeota bacterium]
MINGVYERLQAREQRKAWIEAFVINLALIYYFLTGAYYLVLRWKEMSPADFAYNFHLLIALMPVAIAGSLAWTRSPQSAGRAFIERTNAFLKGLRKEPPGSWWLTFSGLLVLAILALTVVLGWTVTEIKIQALFSAEGMAGARRIFAALFTPNFQIIGLTLQEMVVTIFIALTATTLAIPVAFVGSFFCARNLMKGHPATLSIYMALRIFFNFIRSIEPLIWAIIFSVWVGIGPFAGMLALAAHSVASLIKLYSEQIENIDTGPIEAIEATGANRMQVVWYAVVPQIVLPYLSFSIYRWDINVRMATIIGMVGGGGIGTLLMQYQGQAKWNEAGMIVITIAVVVWLMDYVSARVREAIY